MKRLYLIFIILSIASFDLFAAESYKVENIIVSSTASNAKEAKEKAIEEGKKRAFKILLSRFSSQSNIKVEGLEDVEQFISDFELINEKLSAKTYRANMTITFNRNLIQAYFAAIPKFANEPSLTAQQAKKQNYIICYSRLNKLQDWINIQKSLKENIKGIDSVVPITISTELVTYEVNFSIPIEKLAEDMVSHNIVPIQDEDKIELQFH